MTAMEKTNGIDVEASWGLGHCKGPKVTIIVDPAVGTEAEEKVRIEKIHFEKVRAYDKEDSLAQVILVNVVDDAHVELIATCNTSTEIWQKLLSVYEQPSSQSLYSTSEQLFSAKVIDEEELVQYISRLELTFREVNEELQKHKANVLPEIVLMSRIMSNLPSEFFQCKSV